MHHGPGDGEALHHPAGKSERLLIGAVGELAEGDDGASGRGFEDAVDGDGVVQAGKLCLQQAHLDVKGADVLAAAAHVGLRCELTLLSHRHHFARDYGRRLRWQLHLRGGADVDKAQLRLLDLQELDTALDRLAQGGGAHLYSRWCRWRSIGRRSTRHTRCPRRC